MFHTLKTNNLNNFFEISTKKYNTYLTTVSNSEILKSNNNKNSAKNHNSHKKFSHKTNKINKKYTKSSNNSANHSHRNTLSNYKSNSKNNNNIHNKLNYFSNSNLINSKKASTTRKNLRKKDSQIKLLKKMLQIFGKKLYNPIKSKQDDKFIKNIKLLNIISNNGNILGINSLRKNK